MVISFLKTPRYKDEVQTFPINKIVIRYFEVKVLSHFPDADTFLPYVDTLFAFVQLKHMLRFDSQGSFLK
ncbi:hypothetical protein BWI93_24520 [Siphonobacter sp. BAB-5385]|nr:hypothetical protein BWI93_24520 [Siphonobacter sp. BAB-5385]